MLRSVFALTLLRAVVASDVWSALRAKVTSELKPAKEPTGFEHLLKSPTATGAHGEYTYSKAGVSAGIASWPIPADVKAQVQESVGSVILVAQSVDYRSFTLKVQGSSSILYEVACAGRHLPAANGTSSDKVELAYIYTQSSATLIQQTQDHAYSSCCHTILGACVHHCTKHEQVPRGFTAAELSLIMSVLVDQAYKYMMSIKATARIPLAVATASPTVQAFAAAAPVGVRSASDKLRQGQVGATDVWTALRAKVSSELKPAKEPTGFEHLLKSPTATGAHGEYTYSKAAVSKGIASWPIPADVKAKVQESVGSVILVAKSVDYRSFTLKVKGSSSVLHEVACAGRHLPAANGTSSDNVELAYIYTQSSATLIQQTQDHSYKYCCYKLLWAICTHHCTRHEQVKRGFTPTELSLITSVLVDQAYKYMISIKAAAYVPVAAVAPAMLVTQATVVAAPVTQESLRAASASLRHKAESASIASALVANVVRRGFETFTQEGVVETLTYESARVTELTPIVQKILGAPKDCANDIAMALLGGSFVTDSGGTQWSHHTLTYSVAGDKSGGGSTNFAQFVVRVAKSNPKQRTLFLFSLKTSFTLVPDLIYLRSCSASAGFLGLGSRNDCTDVPTAIPHTLDLASLNVLDSYLTAVGLGLISSQLPNAESMSLLASRPHLLDRQVPAEFEGVLAALRGRLARDRQAAQCESGCSETVRKIVHGALSKWSSSLEVQSMQKLTPDGAPQFIKYLGSSCHVADPAFVKVLGSVLASEKPVVFSTLSCDKSDRCKYLLLVGNSTVGVATDLLIVQQAATFGLAPDLVVVRETNVTATGNQTTDKIHKIPRKVTQADIDAVLAFFEMAVVDRLSAPVLGGSSSATFESLAAPSPTPSSPNMPGKTPVPVPEWQKMLESVVKDSKVAQGVLADIAAGTSIAGPIGGVIGGIIGLIPQIASIFHGSHSHTEQMIGELENDGFSHFEMYQSGPIYYNKLPYHALKSGKPVNPVQMVLKELLDAHLSDVANPQDQQDLQMYITTLANGWASGSNVFVSSGIHYATKNGGGAKVVKLVTNADTVNGHASIMFWATKANIKLADRLMLYRVTDSSSNIIHSSSSQRDEIRRIPREINYTDVTALYNFFDIMAAKAFATTLNLCASTKVSCSYPSIGKAVAGTAGLDRIFV